MSCNNVQILNFNHNIVEVGSDNKLIITDNVKCNSITIPQPVTNILQINSPGPQGPAGASADTGSFVTTSSFNAYTGSSTSQFAGTASYAITASYAMNGGGSGLSGGAENYIPLWSSSTTLTSSYLYQTESILKTIYSGSDIGLKLDFASGQYTLGDYTDPNYQSRIIVNGGAASGDSSLQLALSDNTRPSEINFTIDATNGYLKTSYNGNEVGLKLDFLNNVYQLGNFAHPNSGSITISGSQVQLTGSAIITGSLVVTGSTTSTLGFTGSLQGTSSWANNAISTSFAATASNILGGKATHIPFFKTDTTLATSSIYQSGSTSVIINQDNNTTDNPEALFVWQPSLTSFNVISGKGDLNNYLQLNIQNKDQGVNASSDIVATSNNGNENGGYIDMGINSDIFSGPIGGPLDAYLYTTGSHLHIGNITPNMPVQFFVGGIDTNTNRKFELNANNSHNMTGSLDVSGSIKAFSFTGSLQGNATSATTADTASYSTTLGASLSQPANNQVRLLNSAGGTLSTATINNVTSASHADNASIANFATTAGNGGVTRLINGGGITLIPSTGLGDVTLVSTGVGGVTIISGSNVTQSFNNTDTWTFNHNLGTRVPIITVFDTSYNQIIPQNIVLTDTASATITFPTAESGFAIASLGGATGTVLSASYALLSTIANTASFYPESDPVYIAQKPTLATTGSNTFRGTQIITGSLIISGSGTFTNIGPAIFTGSVSITGSTTQTGNNTLIGNTVLSGSIGISGSSTIQGTTIMTGSLNITGSTIQVGNNTLFGNNTLTGSNTISGSNTIIGGNLIVGGAVITGSLNITGSTIQRGNNTLIGTTTLTGSILINGDIIPEVSKSFDLGSATNPWRSLYVQSGSISIQSDIPGNPDAIISNQTGNVSIRAAGFSITSGSLTPFQISQNARIQVRVPSVPAGDVGAFSIIGSSDGGYQPVTNAGGMIHVTGNENTSTRLNLDNFGNGGTFNAFTARAGRGTASNPSQSLAGDIILRIGAVSWKSGSGFTGAAVANTTLDVITLENATSASHASAFQFYTAGVNGAYTRYLSAQIDATGIQASGSIRASSFTGSLQGTASWASNALTASYINPLRQDVIITGSLKVSGSGYINGLPILTSANTSSFTDGFGWYGAFCSTGSQTNPVANISRSMQLDTTEHTNGVSVVSGSRITFAHAGVYNIQFSAQLESTAAGDNLVNIWFKKNGSNVARSNTLINVAKQAGDKVVAAWNYIDTANANDYIEIVWQSADTHMRLLAATATGNIPVTPSVIVTATQVG
jgi:hypothetical protein